MGDGINDAPALKAADVGISVDSAVDIAKESSDIILLENSLLVLKDGVMEGRRVFGNIIKYIKMAASSNFGNMFSMLGASIFLPFLPMLPIQVLTNNLLYDFSQTTIPTDEVDAEWLTRPRKWAIGELRRFIIFIGPISSIFDYLTFFIMLYVFKMLDEPGPVPHRLVRGIAFHADPHHPRHPHEQDPLPAKPGQQSLDLHLAGNRGGRSIPALFAVGGYAGLRPAAVAVLAAAAGNVGGVRHPDSTDQNLVLSQVRRLNLRSKKNEGVSKMATKNDKMKIKVNQDGPYTVSGGIPLIDRILVPDAEGLSIGWMRGSIT